MKIENLEKLQESFTEKYQVKISNMATKSGDKIYLDPIIVDRVSENPFKLDERKYPVDFAFPITKSYICNIKVPKGYALDEKIPPSIVALPNKSGKFSYEIAESDGILSIKSIYSINKAMFPPEEYAFLKEFYNQIIARHTQQIVLKKM